MKALTVTASIVLTVLVAAIAWFAFFPGPDTGGPSATVAVTPAPPKPAPPPAAAAPAQGSQFDLPPGFGLAGPQPPGQQQQQPALPPPLPQSAPGSPEAPQQTAAVSPPALPEPPETESAAITLVSVPVDELVEESVYGPLPKVAQDGRRAIDVYARPSRYTAKAPGQPPRVAVLVNGMGLSDGITAEAIKGLPPPISVAYGAYGRNLQDWVTQARGDGHEVLLQIPLEPPDYPKTDPGPHTLLTTLPPEENIKRLQWLMSRFTGYVGITNHMGAKFEATSDALVPVMEELKARGLLFLDDGTARTAKLETASAAGQIPDELKGPAAEKAARALGLDFAIADIQIDAVPGDIAKALARLEALAIQQGSAIGVASAKPDTVKQIAAWAEQLPGKGIVLIPVSAAVRSQRQS
ncbi:MAG: divergent polysaccharide deacetylase family protein [Methyloceanibacter sp.]